MFHARKVIVRFLSANPRQLFLLDGTGALLTTIFTFTLFIFPDWSGMPQQILLALTLLACSFMVYSFGCFFGIRKYWRRYLRVILVANALYGCLTLVLMGIFYQRLTIVGLVYFGLEVVVLAVLVYIERSVLANHSE
jgi:hypothetical protein